METISTDQLNPYETAFGLIDSYRGILHTALERSGISADAVQYVSHRFTADRGLLFSLQPTYEVSSEAFHQFCKSCGVSEHVVRAMRERFGRDFHLYRHQEEAISSIMAGSPTVIATGTGSGKTESFLLPILNHCLQTNEKGIKAILLYPMNALANDQVERLSRYAKGSNVRFGILTGATPEDSEEQSPNRALSRREMRDDPPDILLTNYVMLERVLTARKWRPVIEACKSSLSFVVLDELHTYRGTKATQLMFLLQRLREQTATDPLPIGASATLAQSGGYISGTVADQDALQEFLQRILGVSNCRVVTPYYETSDLNPLSWPDEALTVTDNVGHSSTPSDKCKLISVLLGEKVPVSFWLGDTSFWDTDVGLKVARHPFLVSLKSALEENGAKTYQEIVKLYQTSCPHKLEHEEAALAVKSWLNALSIIATDFNDDRQALDMRLHIFLRGLKGYLNRCIGCGSYHPDGSDMCPDCGSALFLVDRDNVSACVAKVRDNTLSPVLYPEEKDGPNTFFVKIIKSGCEHNSDNEDGIRCTLKVDLPPELLSANSVAIPFAPDPEGELILCRHADQSVRDIYKSLVVLSDPIHPREHLRNLVLTILQSLEAGQRRLLGFIDDRERASHDAMAISDELASRFFEVILAAVAPADGPRLNIPSIREAIKAYVTDLLDSGLLGDLERTLFAEMELWLFRYIGEPERFAPSRSGLLTIKDVDDYSDLEQQVLTIFLRERAVDCRYHDAMPESQFIKFQKHWAVNVRQIYCDPDARPDSKDEATCISLSKDSREYADFVMQVGEQLEVSEDPESLKERERTKLQKEHGADLIFKTVEQLSEAGVLTPSCDDGPCRYSLNPEYVLLAPPREDISEHYAAIKDRYLFLARPHSSELTNKVRRETEDQFKQGSIHFLLATPTLEMGIDIGDLRYVMMVGVPPMPSNYAQRAGRAGRRGQSSLVLCYCSHDKAHDRHYFQDPKSMIDGLITPPSLHNPTLETVKKHARAIILADYVDNGLTMREFISSIDTILNKKLPVVLRMCDQSMIPALDEYFRGSFAQECEELLAAALAAKVSPSQYFYNTAFLPDYGFHHDGVQAWDKAVYDELRANKGAISSMEADYIAEREQELAYTKFAPGRIAFLGGNVYRFRADGESSEWMLPAKDSGAAECPVRSYSRILVDQEIGRAHKDAMSPIYKRLVSLDCGDAKGKDLGGIAEIRALPVGLIRFVNKGEKTDGNVEPFTDSAGNRFYMGYQIKRQSLVLSFDNRVFSSMAAPLSCVSALDRTIKDLHRLDESELRIIPYVYISPVSNGDYDSFTHFLFYDASGNGDLPLQDIHDNIDDVLRKASHKIHGCPHCEHTGDNGCYYCLKSFYTQYIAPYAKSSDALNIIDYLIGETAFTPSIEPFIGSGAAANTIIEVRSTGDGVQATKLDSDELIEATSKTAEAVYGLTAKAVRSFCITSGNQLLIRTNIGFLKDTLSGKHHSREGRYAFTNLKYELLRCKSVRVEKL